MKVYTNLYKYEGDFTTTQDCGATANNYEQAVKHAAYEREHWGSNYVCTFEIDSETGEHKKIVFTERQLCSTAIDLGFLDDATECLCGEHYLHKDETGSSWESCD